MILHGLNPNSSFISIVGAGAGRQGATRTHGSHPALHHHHLQAAARKEHGEGRHSMKYVFFIKSLKG